jgi:hypothetical protein
MDEKEMQAQFIQWLAKKTGAKSEQELTEVIKKLQSTEGAMEQTLQQFQSEMSGGQQEQPAYKVGGKLAYIECLSKLKKGGKMDCGCGAKMPKVQKAQAGAALGLFSKIGGAFKGAQGILSGAKTAGTLAKGAQTLATINKVAGYGQQALNIGKNIVGGMQPTEGVQQPTMTAQGTQLGTITPPATANPVTGAPTATVLNTRVAPTLQPMGTQARPPGMLPMKPIAPKLVANGTKLEAKETPSKINTGERTTLATESVKREAPKAEVKPVEKKETDFNTMSFGSALRAARAEGKKTFSYKGKLQRVSSLEEDETAEKARQAKAKAPAKGITAIEEVTVTAKRKPLTQPTKNTPEKEPTKENPKPQRISMPQDLELFKNLGRLKEKKNRGTW